MIMPHASSFMSRFRKNFAIHYEEPRNTLFFKEAAERIHLLVRFFYLYILIWIYGYITRWETLLPDNLTYPLWPTDIVLALGLDNPYDYILIIGVFSSLVCVVQPHFFITRLLTFLSIFFLVSAKISYGYIDHNGHFITYVCFGLLLLPNKDITAQKSLSTALHYCSTYWFIQTFLLFAYSLSGFWKVYYGLDELAAGKNNFLQPTGLSTILAARQMDESNNPMLIDFFVHHIYLTWFLHLSIIYIEFFAILTLFRPALQKPFGIALILFHIGTAFMMDFGGYVTHAICWGVFFVFSPFASQKFNLLNFLRSLPVFGTFIRVICKKQANINATG